MQQEWTEIIKPRQKLFDFKIKELWRYRDLLMLFVRRDFVSVYKQTILGPFWFILQAFLTSLTFALVFDKIAKLPTDYINPMLFYMSGIVCWGYFSQCLTKTSNTFVNNAAIFGKVYFPRMVVPFSIVISSLIGFGIQLLFFVCFYFFFILMGNVYYCNAALFLFPILVLLMAMLGLGFGLIVSSLTIKYRDLQYLITFGVQLLMFVTPIIYPLSKMTGVIRQIIMLNPLTFIIETFRYAFFSTGELDWGGFIYSIIFAVLTLLLGVVMFNRNERSFTDII